MWSLSPTSLRGRLLVLVALAGGLAWAGASSWMFFELRGQVNRVLDNKLVESARLVQTLWQRAPAEGLPSTDTSRSTNLSGARQLACQVWDVDGTLLTRSGDAPESPLARVEKGFANVTVNGEDWRVYATNAPAEGRRVLVGERRDLRDDLANQIATALAVPFLLGLLALTAGLVYGVGRGLRPLQQVARQVGSIDPAKETSWDLPATRAPREVSPLMRAIRGLMARLRQTLERERRFLGDAAHQLRTPLAALKTQAEVALHSDDAAQRERALNQVVAGVERADRLVHQLLTLARFDESGQFPKEPVDLREVVRRAQEAVAEKADEAGSHLATEIPANPVIIQGSSEALESLLTNLMNNAIQHGREGGQVRVRLGGDPPRLEVEDNGPGLDPEERERALARFYRGDQSTGQGSGLGLPIAARVAEIHHGSLELGEGAEGRGLKVTVHFPQE